MKRFLLKIAFSAAAIVAALCGTAFAAELPYSVSYDYMNNAVTVSGEVAPTAKYVTLQVLKDGKKFEDLTVDSSSVLYRYQQDISDGKFSFTVEYDRLQAGVYAAKLVTDGAEEPAEFEITLVNNDTYSSAVSDLNSLANAQNIDGLKNYIATKGSELGFDLSLYGKLVRAEAMRPYMNFVREHNIRPEQSDDNVKNFASFVLMAALQENKVSNIKPYIDTASVGGSAVAADFNTLADTSEKQEYVTSKMTNRTFEKFSEFEDALKEGLILSEIRFASGYGGVKNILSKYGSVAGIKGTAPADVYKEMCGQPYKDASELLAAYNKLNASASRPGGGSSGGGGGGGGKLPTYMEAVYPSETKNETPAEIHAYFYDIDGVEWATEAILGLADMKIINGKSEGYFKPNDFVTREEFAKILVCALGYQEEEYSENVFTDVGELDWFCHYVNIGYKKGLMQGVGDGKFGVGEFITRQDMTVMLCNALRGRGVDVPDGSVAFADKDKIADYAADAVASLYEMGIVNGVSETEFDALGTATRAQAAKIVYECLKYLK